MVTAMRNSNLTEVDWMCIIRYNAYLQYFISYHPNAHFKMSSCVSILAEDLHRVFFFERPSSKQCSGRCHFDVRIIFIFM
jgi:hypothetical protein